jgi:hypothetical protein
MGMIGDMLNRHRVYLEELLYQQRRHQQRRHQQRRHQERHRHPVRPDGEPPGPPGR